MARLDNDFLKLRGSIDELTFSQDLRGTNVRKKPGKKKFKELAEGSQKSALEMKGASKMAREFCRIFNIENKIWMDHYFFGRLAGRFRSLALEDKEHESPRWLDLKRNGHVLEGFECFEKRPLWMSVGGLYPLPEWNEDGTEARLELPELNVKKQITAPEGTNHISFSFAIVPLSNYGYDAQKQDYFPLATYKDKALISHSPVLSLKQRTLPKQQLSLNWKEPFEQEVALVCLVGVQFYVGMNGEIWKKGKTEAMRVVGVG